MLIMLGHPATGSPKSNALRTTIMMPMNAASQQKTPKNEAKARGTVEKPAFGLSSDSFYILIGNPMSLKANPRKNTLRKTIIFS